MAKVKLHRCSYTFLHTDLDACWKVQRALDEQGIEYEVVKHGFGKGQRPDVVALSGQKRLPVIEYADGTAYRAESSDMAARVRAGTLGDTAQPAAAAQPQ
jgi:glutathione S-transferase